MLFRNHFTTPGPGVDPDTPRKTGLPRLLELLGRDLSSLYKASFLAGVGSLPAFLLAGFGISQGSPLLTLAAALLTGWLVGPFLCGAFDTTLRALRDEPGYWWLSYRRAFRANFRSCLLPGMVFTALVSLQVLAATLLLGQGNPGALSWAGLVLSLLLTTGFFSYYWAQMALIDTSGLQRVKNSFLLFIGFLPQTLAASALQLLYWGLHYLFLPASLVIWLILGCWLPLLLGLMILYPSMDRVFHIEETLRQRQQDQDFPSLHGEDGEE